MESLYCLIAINAYPYINIYYIIIKLCYFLVSAYKKKIGFGAQLLIEPKPKEPTKHQYDYGKTYFNI